MSKLTPQQLKAIECEVRGNITAKEVAAYVGVSSQTIYRWRDQDDYLNYRDKMMKKHLNHAAAKAINTMIALLDSEQDNVRYSAAKDILDRAGFKATEKLEIDNASKIKVTWEE